MVQSCVLTLKTPAYFTHRDRLVVLTFNEKHT
uniref:Uncharacterized protein n=1 Tax=Anguilla anguilla TaxID=7936 RepID=A0A0E9T4B2_ANGAN